MTIQRTRKIRRVRRALGLTAAALIAVALVGCETTDIALVTAGRNALRAVSGLEPGAVEVDGHSIAFMERAGDGPTMVLLHGFVKKARKTPKPDLDLAAQRNDPALSEIAPTPEFDNLRSDPRWMPFLKRIGKAPEQLAAVEFNVTRPE